MSQTNKPEDPIVQKGLPEVKKNEAKPTAPRPGTKEEPGPKPKKDNKNPNVHRGGSDKTV